MVLVMAVSSAYPVSVRQSGIKMGIVIFMLVVCVILTMVLSMWSRMPNMIDVLTGGRAGMADRFATASIGQRSKWKSNTIIVLIVLAAATALAWFLLPQIGSSTLSFDQFDDKYQVEDVQPTKGFDHSLLRSGGRSFVVEGSHDSQYPVEWTAEGGSLTRTGTIDVSSGKARLTGADGTQPALR